MAAEALEHAKTALEEVSTVVHAAAEEATAMHVIAKKVAAPVAEEDAIKIVEGVSLNLEEMAAAMHAAAKKAISPIAADEEMPMQLWLLAKACTAMDMAVEATAEEVASSVDPTAEEMAAKVDAAVV